MVSWLTGWLAACLAVWLLGVSVAFSWSCCWAPAKSVGSNARFYPYNVHTHIYIYLHVCMHVYGLLGLVLLCFQLALCSANFCQDTKCFCGFKHAALWDSNWKGGEGSTKRVCVCVCYWDVFYCESALKRFSTDLDWLFCGFAFLGSGLLNVYIYLHVCMLICKYIPIYIYIVSCWNAGAYLVCLDWICFSLQLHTLTSLYVVFTHISIYVNVYAYLCFCT